MHDLNWMAKKRHVPAISGGGANWNSGRGQLQKNFGRSAPEIFRPPSFSYLVPPLTASDQPTVLSASVVCLRLRRCATAVCKRPHTSGIISVEMFYKIVNTIRDLNFRRATALHNVLVATESKVALHGSLRSYAGGTS